MLALVLPSGLGVKIQDLTGEQSDDVLLTAAKMLPPDGVAMQLTQIETREGLGVMIKAVTKGPCKRSAVQVSDADRASIEEAMAKAVAAKEWDLVAALAKNLSVLGLGLPDPVHTDNQWVPFDPDAEKALVKTFPDPRDYSALKLIYQHRTRVSGAEVAALMGKAVEVTS